MYPFIRMVKEMVKYRKAAPLPLMGTHVSSHRCWPWDIDLWAELNNGRTLSLFDLGRIPMAYRIGLLSVLRKNGWGMTMAGVSVRYRRRVRTFEKIEMRSRAVGSDDKFVYIEQSMWRMDGECANHALYRAAFTGKTGIVAPTQVLQALGTSDRSSELPDWVQQWITAEAARPWPPMQD
ncbi:acyl-CoA thioesterase [Shimia sp.]|uniref:acyl-CoA thioesterase n=1 Tax=Shimia sp. TaxID=1954381 RepID=UPI003299FC58